MSSVHFYISNCSWNTCQITRTFTIQKIEGTNIKFQDYMTSQYRAIRSQSQIFFDIRALDFWNYGSTCLTVLSASIYDIKRPLALSTTFYDFPVSRNFFPKAEIRHFGATGNQRIRDCREPTDLPVHPHSPK